MSWHITVVSACSCLLHESDSLHVYVHGMYVDRLCPCMHACTDASLVLGRRLSNLQL